MAFPGTYLNRTVEVALGADLTADPSTWAWTDASSHIRETAPITIRRGGFDGQVQAPPSTCTFTVDNTDGRWVPTNPSGAWYGQLSKGTPVRIVVDEGTPSVRWTGFLTALPPRWNTKETDRYVEVTASGILQRLERGKTPLRSALVRTISGTSRAPVAYWPGEDGSGANSIAEFYGAQPMLTVNEITPASDGPAGSASLPEFTSAAGVTGVVPSYVATGAWSLLTVFNFPASPSAATVILRWHTTGTYPIWQVTLTPGSPDTIALEAYDVNQVQQINDSMSFAANTNSEPFDQWLILYVGAEQSGTSVNYQLGLFDASQGSSLSGTEASITAGTVTKVVVPASTKLDGMHAGHWAVWDFDIDPVFTAEIDPQTLDGYDGMDVSLRAALLTSQIATIDGGVYQFTGDSDNLMGPQPQATVLQILRECEAVTNGRLVEAMDPTDLDRYLILYTKTELENQDAELTLNHDSGHLSPPFDPTDDDQETRNDWTVTRSTSGSSARIVADSGALTPALVGTYDDSATVNVYADTDLIHQAGWRLNIGTYEGLRFPVVTLDFARNPSLISSWIGCDVGYRVTITNPPEGIAPDSIDLLIEGWTEVLGPKRWTVQLNCSPFGPWHVFRLAETSSDTNVFLGRLAEDEKCALGIGIDDNDLSMDIDPNFYRWTEVADDFPLNIRLGGEVATVSGISTTGATFVAVGTPSHIDNAAVTPALYTGHTAGHVIFVVAAIRSSGTGTLATPTDYTRLPIFGATDHVQVFAKVHDGSEVAPTVTPSGGSAGDTVSAFTFGFGNMPISLDDLGDIVLDRIVQLNASAQNIAYGGLYQWRYAGSVQLVIGWKQDDYTSVAPPSGFTEMVEASTIAGSDQSLYCAYRIDTTPALVVEGSLAVTGGASAISRSAVVAIAGGKQVMTLSARSVNGVQKAHSVGTRIAVNDPAVLAL